MLAALWYILQLDIFILRWKCPSLMCYMFEYLMGFAEAFITTNALLHSSCVDVSRVEVGFEIESVLLDGLRNSGHSLLSYIPRYRWPLTNTKQNTP